MNLAFLSNANSLHLKEWAEYLARELRHQVTVFTIPAPRLAYEGVELVHIGNSLSSRKAAWFALIPRLRRELRARAPEVFVAYRVVSYGFLAALSGYRPLVLAAQGGSLIWPPDDPFGQLCARFAIGRADLCHAWSDNIRQEYLRFGADDRRVLVCPRGIDLELFPPVAERPGPPRIATTRALLPSYNTIRVVEAMNYLRRRMPDAVCEIAGDGPERPRLEERAADLRLNSNVRFVGQLSRTQIAALTSRAHVYCSMTVTDGLPLSHFEAMATGAFPVVSDIEANRIWIRHGENGLLAPLDDPAALADFFEQALRDHGLRARAAEYNRALIEREFDRDRNMRRIAEAYEQVARRGQAAQV